MTKNITGFAVAIIAMAFVSARCEAANTYYVDNKLGDYNGHDGSSWELALFRIQDAVAKAKSGDTVIVAPGVYGDDQGTVVDSDGADGSNENYSYITNRIWIHNKNITLRSSEGADATHIVGKHADTDTGIGEGAIRCIAMSGTANIGGTRIEGFTIRDGGTVAFGTGKTYNKAGEVTGKECPAAHRGGGLLFNFIAGGKHSAIHIVDCVISNCVAAEGAAAFGVSFIRCQVFRNRTCRTGGEIAAHCNAANSVFAGNGCEDSEWTVSSRHSSYPVNVVNSTFFNNKGLILKGIEGAVATVCNSFIQQCGNITSTDWAACAFLNCVADCDISTGEGNRKMELRADNAQLAAPIYGDFRPVARPSNPLLFGYGVKDQCEQAWIPDADRNLDIAKEDRWGENGCVTVGAYQLGKEMAGGCITVACMDAGDHFAINGQEFDGLSEGYFYAVETPSQYRIKMISGNDEADIHHVRLGGYYEQARHTGIAGDITVTAPPFSSCRTLLVQAVKAQNVIWTDPNYDISEGDPDGSKAHPYVTLQDAVDASAGKANVLIKACKGSYASGGGFTNGNCRVVITNSLCIRAVDGPAETFIVGGAGNPAYADGCGADACRCVGMSPPGSKVGEAIGIVGFTLTGGRTCTNGEECSTLMKMGGGLYVAQHKDNAQLVDCVITDCVAIQASAAYSGWLVNCRIGNCRQAASNARSAGNIPARGVVSYSYLSGCVIGPNQYGTVSVDAHCKMWNCTINETQNTLRCSVEAALYNVLMLNFPQTQSNITEPVAGLVIETDAELALAKAYEKVADAKIADRTLGDFRPLVGSPVVSAGTTNGVEKFERYTVGGIHGGLFPSGQPISGASFDVAVPVVLTDDRGVSVSGGLGTPFVSKEHPQLKLSATNGKRTFYGFKINGELATAERTLTLDWATGAQEFSVEPLYAKFFAISIR